jgi:hypothetical protein
VADQVINVILQLRSAHFEFLDFLIRSEIDFLFDAVNFVIEPVILIEQVAEMVIGALEAPDDIAMFREFSEYRVMKVHWRNLL